MGKSDVLHGTLDLLVLKALSLGPRAAAAVAWRLVDVVGAASREA
jgi:hypothetical protein